MSDTLEASGEGGGLKGWNLGVGGKERETAKGSVYN